MRRLLSLVKSNQIKFAAFILLLIAVGVGLSFAIFGPKKEAAREGEVLSQAPRPVEEFIVGQQEIANVSYSGTVDSDTALTLSSQTAGMVISIDAKEQDNLFRGGLIASLGTAPGQVHQSVLGVQTAQQQLNSARIGLDRARTTADLLIEQADLGVETAKDAADLANQQLDLTQSSIDSLFTTINTLKDQLSQLETIPNPTPDQLAQIESLKSAITSAEIQKNSLESGKTTLENAAKEDNPQVKASKRNLELIKSQAAAAIEAAENGVRLAEIGLTSSQLLADTSQIRMPFAGTVDKIFVDLGQTVAPGTQIARILGASQLKIVIQVPAGIASKIASDEQAKVTLQNQEILAIISRISQIAESKTRLFEVEIIPEKNVFQIGELIDVKLPIRLEILDSDFKKLTPLMVPLDALYVAGNDRYVFINNNGIAFRKDIKIGQVFGDLVEVSSGLKRGDRLIVARELSEGEQVTPTQI